MKGIENPRKRLRTITGRIPDRIERWKWAGSSRRYLYPNTSSVPKSPKMAPEAPTLGTNGGRLPLPR